MLAAAVLAELWESDSLKLEARKIFSEARSFQKDRIHQLFLDTIRHKTGKKRLGSWVQYWAFRGRTIRKMIQSDLIRKGLIRVEQRHFLLFPYKLVFPVNGHAFIEIRKKLVDSALKNEGTAGDYFPLLLLRQAGLLRRLFPEKEQRREANRQLKQMLQRSKTESDGSFYYQVITAVSRMQSARAAAVS